jgi:hypothetical protein
MKMSAKTAVAWIGDSVAKDDKNMKSEKLYDTSTVISLQENSGK